MTLDPTTDSPRRLAVAQLEDRGQGYYEVCFRALGSSCQLFFGPVDILAAESYRRAASTWIESFEARCSRFLPTSILSQINAHAGAGWVDTDPHIDALLDLCEQYHFVTSGAFDATSLPLTRLWDWKQRHDTLPTAEEIEQARQLVGWNRVQRTPGRVLLPIPGMMLDFGGVGKEFAVDCLKQLAVSMGIAQIMVDLGGDIAVHGESPEGGGWYVGLEDPSNPGECHCGIRLKPGAAVATSGDYRRCFEFGGRTYGHILDCRTGWPVAHGTRSVTVIAPRCIAAGLLTTSAMTLPAREAITMLERNPRVQGCLWSGGRLYETRGFRSAILAPEALPS